MHAKTLKLACGNGDFTDYTCLAGNERSAKIGGIFGGWAISPSDRVPTVSSGRTVIGRTKHEHFPWTPPTAKSELSQIFEIRSYRLKLLPYTASITILPSDFENENFRVGLADSSSAAKNAPWR